MQPLANESTILLDLIRISPLRPRVCKRRIKSITTHKFIAVALNQSFYIFIPSPFMQTIQLYEAAKLQYYLSQRIVRFTEIREGPRERADVFSDMSAVSLYKELTTRRCEAHRHVHVVYVENNS